jgi:hypothetical protein
MRRGRHRWRVQPHHFWGPALAVVLGVLPPIADAESDAFSADDAEIVSDAELSEQTGKFMLSNGTEIAMSVVSDSVVNGQLVLRTVFRVDHDASVKVFAPSSDQPVSVGTNGSTGTAGTNTGTVTPNSVQVMFDRDSGLATVTPTYAVNSAGVHLGTSEPSDPTAGGLVEVPVTPGGAPVSTPGGQVTLAQLSRGTVVQIAGDQFQVSHLVGSAIATAVTNSANDRTIDVVTNVNIDLRNVTPYTLGSAALKVDTLALEAARGLVR